MITVIGLWAVLGIDPRAQVTVMAVRLGANDVVALAKFYDMAFGVKEIDRVGRRGRRSICPRVAPGRRLARMLMSSGQGERSEAIVERRAWRAPTAG